MDQAEPITIASDHQTSRLMWQVGGWILVSAIAVAAFGYGLQWRRQLWDQTDRIHYTGDVAHGFSWGHVGSKVNLFAVYDLYATNRIGLVSELDYTPLRLMIVTYWARWAEKTHPEARGWDGSYDLTSPMLTLNTIAEALASILVFLLVRYWVIRQDDASRLPLAPARPMRGVVRGMIGAMFFWFNPAVVWDGHGFPQWDVWNTPFYLGAILLGCLEWWFAAGVCIVIGAFLKGQILLVAPLLIIWPLVQLRFGAVLRFVCGFAFGGALLALPWFNTGHVAIVWYCIFVLAMALITPIVIWRKLDWRWVVAFVALAMLLAWPWASDAAVFIRLLPLVLILAVALLRFSSPRLLPSLYALAIAAAIFLIIPLFHGSTNWYTWGFEFGTKKIMWMATRDTYNLPWILEQYYHWSDDPRIGVSVPWSSSPIEFRSLMLLCYAACLVICGIGAAIHSRRNDARFLVAVVAPWLCWFVLLTQLNNRYLIWASGFSGLLIATSLGMTLLGTIVSFIGWAAIAQIMCWDGGDPSLARIVNPVTPHLAWPLMLLAGIYLYIAIAPRKRSILA